jgi:hypothetical protein
MSYRVLLVALFAPIAPAAELLSALTMGSPLAFKSSPYQLLEDGRSGHWSKIAVKDELTCPKCFSKQVQNLPRVMD